MISSFGEAGLDSGSSGGEDVGGGDSGMTGAVKDNWLVAQSIQGLVRVNQE